MSSPPHWRHLTAVPFPDVVAISDQLRRVAMPSMEGKLVYIASDTGGEHKGSNYIVATAIAAALEGSVGWEVGRRGVRARWLADGRRMAFKSLGDRQRAAALDSFLEAAGEIDGLVLSLAFRKHIGPVFAPPQALEKWRATAGLNARWSVNKFERMVRMANLVAMLVGGLTRDGQHVYWISDDDEMFSNSDHSRDVARLMGGLSNVYVQHTPGALGVGTTSIDPGDRAEEDLASVADLIAGALSEILTKHPTERGLDDWVPTDLGWKAHEIGYWMSEPHSKLRFATFVYEPRDGGGFRVRQFRLRPSSLVVP